MTDTPVQYRVAHDGTITSVDETFEAFARENGAPGLAQAVIGRPIVDFLAGPEVRSLYETLMERVRASHGRFEFPFRCDAPDLRRFMRMRMEPLADGGLCFTATLEREEPREPVPVEWLMSRLDSRDARDLVALCSWCKRVRCDDGAWREVEEVMARGLMDRDRTIAISHAACPTCEAEMLARL